MNFLDALPQRYRLILCDIWGVVHDGVHLYPGARARLTGWRSEGRSVVLISNAPRTAEAVIEQLHRLGLSEAAWNGVVTGGDAGIAAVKEVGLPVGFIGTQDDRRILERAGVRLAEDASFTELVCTGLDEQRRHVEDYRTQLEELADRDVLFHCLNPDRVVIVGGCPVPCAGALADIYLGLGGRVEWYGKPYPAIYRHALKIAGNPPADEILAIGDGLQTDMLGAALMGFDAVFIQGGIHAGEPFPEDFAKQNGLGSWRPVAVLDSLSLSTP